MSVREESAENIVAVEEQPETVVNPWEVTGVVDYDKLIADFGCKAITPEQVIRIEKLTGKRAHPLLRRGIFFSHRCARVARPGARCSSGPVPLTHLFQCRRPPDYVASVV